MNKQRRTSKTTLIIMIAAVLIILVAAFYLWRNHQISSRVDTAFKATDAAKVAVMEAATVQGGLTHIKASQLGYSPGTPSDIYVSHINIADDGSITLVTQHTGATPDIQLLLTPTQAGGSVAAPITWQCSVLAGQANLAPAECHKNEPLHAAHLGGKVGPAPPSSSP